MNRLSKHLILPIGVVSFAVFLVVARNRPIDPDEGFYILASRIVFRHEVPYRDFFYTQTPMLPYVYGLWFQFVGASWLSARSLSTCFASGLSALLYVQICRETNRWAAGVFGALLFTSSALIFGWMPIAKTYVLSSLLLFFCYVIVSRCVAGSPQWLLSIAGLLFGLSIEVRLYFIGTLPILLLWIVRSQQISRRWSALFYFNTGFLIGMLPIVYFFIHDRDAFVFSTLGYHAIRNDSGLIGGFRQKIWTLARALIYGPEGNGLQLAMLLVASSISIWKERMPDAARLAFQIATTLGVICFLPTPTYAQYLCVIIPFLIVCVACSPNVLRALDWSHRSRLTLAIACAALAYIAVSTTDYSKFFGVGKRTVSGTRDNWELGTVRLVSQTIDNIAQSDEIVVSFWPGFLAESTVVPYSGLECDSGLKFSTKLTLAQLAKYHIASRSQIENAIHSRIPRIVVLGNQEYLQQSFEPYIEMLEGSGYNVARRIEGTLVYVRSDRAMFTSH